jgi:hypothetical protein
MAIPGSISSLMPDGPDKIVRDIKDLRRDLTELGPSVARSFAPVIARLDATDADLIAKQAALDAANVQILALIGQVIVPLANHDGINNFGLATGANVEKLRSTITVPTGYSRAQISVGATMHALNSTAAVDDCYLAVTINGATIGASSQITAGAGWGTSLTATGVGLLTGLGTTFYVTAMASSGAAAWATNTVNFVNLDTTVTYLK